MPRGPLTIAGRRAAAPGAFVHGAVARSAFARGAVARGAVALLALALAGPGCAPRRPVPAAERAESLPPVASLPASPARDDDADLFVPELFSCTPLPARPKPGGTIRVRLVEPVSPATAPEPRNDAERHVFRNLYETLVTVDCEGGVAPGLASAWSSEDGGRRWVFTLREGSRFWDGRPVRAADVRESWLATQSRAQATGCLLPWIWLDASAASVRPLDERRLEISLPEPQPDLLPLLAHAAFAVAGPPGRDGWPAGSGPCQPVAGVAGADTFLACAPFAAHPTARPPWRRLEFRWPRVGHAAAPDARSRAASDQAPRATAGQSADAWDVEVIRTHSQLPPGLTREGCIGTALPIDRLYLLLQPPPAPGLAPLDAAAVAARCRVLAESLPASPIAALFFRAPRPETCPQLFGPAASAAPGREPERSGVASAGTRWVHAEGDELGARLAAGLLPEGAALDSVPPQALSRVVREGGAVVVLPWPRCFASPCLQLASLLSSAAWLQTAAAAAPNEPPAAIARRLLGSAVIPLVASRPELAVRRGLCGVRVGYDGALLLAEAGWTDGAPAP